MLALLIKGLLGNAYALILALKSTQIGIRLSAMGILAAAYISCVVGFSTFIQPLLSNLFSTQYGQVVGLAFPPVAGTVLGGFVTVWGCIVAKRYTRWVFMIGVGK